MPAIRAKFGASATSEGCLVWKNGENINYGGYLCENSRQQKTEGMLRILEIG